MAVGKAPLTWVQRARASTRVLPAWAPAIDLSQVRDINDGALGKLREAIQSREGRFDHNNPLPTRGLLKQRGVDPDVLAVRNLGTARARGYGSGPFDQPQGLVHREN